MSDDITATWQVPLSDGVHTVQFSHGTTTGSRALVVDGKVVKRESFMFKLVGTEQFKVGNSNCTIRIDAAGGLAYEYSLLVDGKPLDKFTQTQAKALKCWLCPIDSRLVRVVLEKDSLNVMVDGRPAVTAGEFTDEGTETHFSIGNHSCYIKAISSGHKRTGMLHALIVDGREVPEAAVDDY